MGIHLVGNIFVSHELTTSYNHTELVDRDGPCTFGSADCSGTSRWLVNGEV